ncbi:MAG: hypothetical protein ACLU6Y_13925 [Ruminococcus sp.]
MQIAGMIFQTRSSQRSVQTADRNIFQLLSAVFLLLSPLFLQLLCSFFHISPILSYINVNFSRIFILALKFYKFFSIMISIWVSQ